VRRLVLKSPAEIEIMDQANRVLHEILAALEERIHAGMSTLEIDRFAEERIRAAGGIPAFKGYPHPNRGPDFPGSVCTSVNSEVVHGIPSAQVILREGDIVSVDMGIIYHGYYGDRAATFPVGTVSPEAGRLLRVTREALELGVRQARPGNRVSDIGYAIQTHVESNGFSVVREFVGHGIGSELHEEPQIPNFGAPGRLGRLVEGMVLALEPMVNQGAPEVELSRDDGWTARTRDHSLSAHFEVCVALTASGPRELGSLPASDGGP
jgi:methionyl aminopeptidase